MNSGDIYISRILLMKIEFVSGLYLRDYLYYKICAHFYLKDIIKAYRVR
jgi:hypothetical protein